MKYQDPHLSDQQLLLESDGEISAQEAKRVREHLAQCWECRSRRQELESAIAGFVRAHHEELNSQMPPPAGSRALLGARLTQATAESSSRPRNRILGMAAAAAAVLLLGLFVRSVTLRRTPIHRVVIVSIPDSRLTPGAAILVTRQAVCSQTLTKNKAVPVALQREVFKEYGIPDVEPREYEVDYLITPALGGADDIHNLWPQSHSSTMWSAEVKDELEDRLREMVCEGSLDLAEAQREIAGDWIAAYKKYFHTDRPLPDRLRQMQ